MKVAIQLIICSCLCIPAVSQVAKNKVLFQKAYAPKDTQTVYIAEKLSQAYTDQIFEGFQEDKALSSQVLLKALKAPPASFKTVPVDIAKDWISLHLYKGDYYGYAPSEANANRRIGITDSTLYINYSSDGYLPALLQAAKYLDARILSLKTRSLYPSDEQILFHFLNAAKTLAVVEFPLRTEGRYQLMTTKNNLASYPLIVNDTPNARAPEWSFEQIDYNALLADK